MKNVVPMINHSDFTLKSPDLLLYFILLLYRGDSVTAFTIMQSKCSISWTKSLKGEFLISFIQRLAQLAEQI